MKSRAPAGVCYGSSDGYCGHYPSHPVYGAGWSTSPKPPARTGAPVAYRAAVAEFDTRRRLGPPFRSLDLGLNRAWVRSQLQEKLDFIRSLKGRLAVPDVLIDADIRALEASLREFDRGTP
jgi:hypothetical protein